MKHFYVLLCLLAWQFVSAQQQDPQSDRFNYESGEIIVKLKDDVFSGVTYNKSGQGKTSMDIGDFLGIKDQVKTSEVLFHKRSIESSLKRKQAQAGRKAAQTDDQKARNGYEEEDIISLKNIFLLELSNEQENIEELIASLKENPDVEFAEPNYRYTVNDFTINSEVLTEADLKKIRAAEKPAAFTAPNDALYSQQSNIAAVKLDQVWESGITGDSTQVIAILDTGVDYTHPDLEANSWINQAELNGVAGYDDDGNGYIDDIHGWDFINLDGEPLDDNMHGTHVAGIAGAVGNNGIGITGAAWNVKLLSVKILNYNGIGNSSTIAKGIEYAANNGATVINMSFGSSAESMVMKAALNHAYATTVLVASAGNSGICIGPGKCNNGQFSEPSYPGAFPNVIGVQDTAGYSNFDQDGPTYSGYPNLLNYEVKAPGSAILSTVPGGGYKNLTGTSMSAPLVAGGISLYLKAKPEDNIELLFGNLINSANTFIDFKAALDVIPTPQLKVLSAVTKDTLNGQNGNNFLEPNEIIEIFPLIKNYWGPADDVRIGIEFAEFEDQTKATIIEKEISVGSVASYTTLKNPRESIKVQIADSVPNGTKIVFNLKVWAGLDQNFLSENHQFIIDVTNKVFIGGFHNQDLILYPENKYLLGEPLVFENASLIIMPGTTLEVGAIFGPNGIISRPGITWLDGSTGSISAIGTKESPITIKSTPIYKQSDSQLIIDLVPISKMAFEFCNFEYIEIALATSSSFIDCRFHNSFPIQSWNSSGGSQPLIIRSNFTGTFPGSGFSIPDILNANSTEAGIKYLNIVGSPHGSYHSYRNDYFSNFIDKPLVGMFLQSNTYVSFENVYIGTSSDKILDEINKDALDGAKGFFTYDNAKREPYEEAHGIVWKVLINGVDPQDEIELMDPVGIGSHKFQVYFNRPMDTLVDPQISYGVREPYNQKIISEEGSWSADGKIYSVNHEVKIGTADGVNRIRVQGARDLDYFEVPVEDFRFNMLVQSAGSASSGFFANPELGKITLTWEEPSADLLEDVLGYNMYRHEATTDSTFTEPVKINETLIADVNYSDFDVEEGKKYFYQYKILRTNFDESDFSKTVAASPLTSQLGDSNGDFSVNVLDLVQDVDYILGNNPQPFIFKAADVNADQAINVLDIVGTVDIINSPSTATMSVSASNPSLAYYSSETVGEVKFYWEEDDLYMESEHAVGAFQLAFEEGFSYEINKELSSFEWSNYKQEESRIVMMYSFTGAAIKAGKTKILSRNSADSALEIEKAVVGTPKGEKLAALFSDKDLTGIEAPKQTDKLQVVKFWPNPTDGIVNLKYYLPENMDKVVVSIFNLQGIRVMSSDNLKNTAGPGEKEFYLNSLTPGIYLFVVDAVRAGEIKHREAKKIIIK